MFTTQGKEIKWNGQYILVYQFLNHAQVQGRVAGIIYTANNYKGFFIIRQIIHYLLSADKNFIFKCYLCLISFLNGLKLLFRLEVPNFSCIKSESSLFKTFPKYLKFKVGISNLIFHRIIIQ